MALGQPRNRNLVTSRRRRVGDDGDEEHELGSIDYDSQSEGSAAVGTEEDNQKGPPKAKMPANGVHDQAHSDSSATGLPLTIGVPATQFPMAADTEAMMNGLEIPPGNHDEDIMEFDDEDMEEYVPATAQPVVEQPQLAKPTQAEQPNPPPLVIERPPQQPPEPRKSHTGRPSQSQTNRTSSRWAHDLHDTVREPVQPAKAPQKSLQPTKGPTLSSTMIVGAVTMRVALPGMKESISYEKMPVKHHVRLPDLRPPLRRDKPVRIAIEDNPPRYIFPSIERSFIFIPRAQRPNQQSARYRNRPYFSQFSSRRGSVYGGSNQGASGGISRRSSIAREGLISPSESVASRAPVGAPTGPASRPVVRLPTGNRPSSNVSTHTGTITHHPHLMPYPLPSRPALRENREGPIPMHQPKPQKTVSLNSLETPGRDQLQAPQQQEQQPFHHQFPMGSAGQDQYMAPSSGGGQSSMLPEQAVNAQPFQPGQAMFYPHSYSMQSPYQYYPAAGDAHMMPYGAGPVAGYPMYSQPMGYMMPMGPPSGIGNEASMYSQESNGTMYYYPPGGQHQGETNGYAISGDRSGMKPEANEFYYQPPPPMMYYPTQT